MAKNTFKPKKANSEVSEIKKTFLKGNSIKIDGRGLVEVTENKYNNVLHPCGWSEQCFRTAVSYWLEEE